MRINSNEAFASRRIMKGLPLFIDVNGVHYKAQMKRNNIIIIADGRLVEPSASWADVVELLDKGSL